MYSPGSYRAPAEREILEICAGAVLTQNTAWKNVEKALGGLDRAGLLDAGRLAACPLPRLERAIRSSGYFRQKARRLKEFCARARRDHPEGFRKWFGRADAASLRAELLSYRGVGPETADSMVLYAAGKASFVIDAYTRRFGERYGLGRGLSYSDWKALFEGALPSDAKIYNEYHALLVKLGKDFCKKSAPLCGACPLRKSCRTGAARPAARS